jgi:hypothetical protein
MVARGGRSTSQGPSAGKTAAMRPSSTASLPKVDAPSPMAMNAGAKTVALDVLVSSFGRYDSTTVRLLLLAEQPREPTVAIGLDG